MQLASVALKRNEISLPEIQNILYELDKSRNISSKLHQSLIANPDARNQLDSLEHSLNQIHQSLTRPKDSLKVNYQQRQFTKKQYSLLDILKRSIPKTYPSTVKIILPDEDVKVFGHMYKLIVLFSSLMENSIQAMSNSGIIKINAISMGAKIKIEIQDSGPGISDDVQAKLFSKLTTTKKHGSGLGTMMAKSIVDWHNGTISVRNNPTTFTIQLPLE